MTIFRRRQVGFLGCARNFGVQWVALLCVVNGRSLEVKCFYPIKSDSNFAIYKFLLVGFCCFGPVYGWSYAAVGGFACRQGWSVCGFHRRDLDVQLWTGFF